MKEEVKKEEKTEIKVIEIEGDDWDAFTEDPVLVTPSKVEQNSADTTAIVADET